MNTNKKSLDRKIKNKIKKLSHLVELRNISFLANKKKIQVSKNKAEKYLNKISKFEQIRGGKLIYPYLGSGHGWRSYVLLDDGSIKLDLINGIGVYHFGHGNKDVIESCLEGAVEDIPINGNLQQNKISFKLSKKFLKLANFEEEENNNKFDHVFLSSSGVMAGENALKIAFHKVNGVRDSKSKNSTHVDADRVLAFKNNFAGRTLSFSQINDKPAFRVGLPITTKVDYIPFYDEQRGDKSIEESVDILKKLLKENPHKYGGMIFELVQGEGGFWTAPRKFFVELMEVLKQNKVPVLVDEVQTFARTPKMFAFQYFDLAKYIDVVWIGKASQVCATIFKKEFKPKAVILAQTYTSSSSTLFSSLKILDKLEKNKYFDSENKVGKISKLHNYFIKKIQKLEKEFKNTNVFELNNIKDKNNGLSGYGLGAMIAFSPFKKNPEKVLKLVNLLFEKGLIVGTAGSNPVKIRFLPAIGAIKKKDINIAFKLIKECVHEILNN